MKTLLILVIIHTVINVFLCGTRLEDIKDVWIDTHEAHWRKLYKIVIIIIIFLLCLIEIELVSSIANYFQDEVRIKIDKYRLYLFGLNIYFKPIIVTDEGEKDLYLVIKEQPYYSIKKFCFFDVVYRNNNNK